MSSEKWKEDICACPCGKGKIVNEVDSPDHAWGYTTRYPSIDCGKCYSEWYLDWQGNDCTIVLRSSAEEYNTLQNRISEIDSILRTHTINLVNRYFERLNLTQRIREWEELRKLGISEHDLVKYRRERRQGKSIGFLSRVPKNGEWLSQQAATLNERKEVLRLFEERMQCNEASKSAKARIERRPIPKD